MRKIVQAFSVPIIVLAFCLLSGQAVWAAGTSDAVLSTLVNSKIHFRPIVKSHGVEFRWYKYSFPKKFVRYEIVRTDKKPAKKYIQDGVVAGETNNRYSTNFMETLDAGTYYYSLCVVTKTERVCSAIKTVTIKNKLPVTVSPKPVSSTTQAYQTAQSDQLVLSVTPAASGTIMLSWTPFVDSGAGFKWYKPVRAQNVADPYYPRDGYLAHLTDINSSTFVDDSAPTGTDSYRICAVDGQDGLWCGNIVNINK